MNKPIRQFCMAILMLTGRTDGEENFDRQSDCKYYTRNNCVVSKPVGPNLC